MSFVSQRHRKHREFEKDPFGFRVLGFRLCASGFCDLGVWVDNVYKVLSLVVSGLELLGFGVGGSQVQGSWVSGLV